MMRLLIAILFLISMLGCTFNSKQRLTKTDEIPKAKIAFSNRTVDFGALSNDTSVQAQFWIRNIGASELLIRKIDVECSCTGYKLNNDTILPGDSAKLSVYFNSKNQGEGLIRKAIFIESNTEKEYNTLFIRCIILPN